MRRGGVRKIIAYYSEKEIVVRQIIVKGMILLLTTLLSLAITNYARFLIFFDSGFGYTKTCCSFSTPVSSPATAPVVGPAPDLDRFPAPALVPSPAIAPDPSPS